MALMCGVLTATVWHRPLRAEESRLVELDPFETRGLRVDGGEMGRPVTVVDRQAAGSLAPNQITDLAATAPNLQSGSSGLRGYGDILALRGIGNTPYFSSPAVAVYADGLPTGDLFAFNGAMDGYAQAILHRGPGGARFGFNAPGGVIELLPAAPSPQTTLKLTGEAGERGTIGLGAEGQGSFGQNAWQWAAGFRHRQSDGFVKNQRSGATVDTRESTSGEVSLKATLAGGWEIGLSGQAGKTRDGAQRLVPVSAPWATDNSDYQGVFSMEDNRQQLRVAKSWEDSRLEWSASRGYWRLSPFNVDFDFSPAPLITSSLSHRQQQWQQELRWSSLDPETTAWSWVAGVYYRQATARASLHRVFYGNFEDVQFGTREDAGALFGSLGWRFHQDWQASVGLRYDEVRKKLDRARQRTLGTDPTRYLQDRFSDLGPSAELSWSGAADWRLTARVTRAWQAGGFSAYTPNPALMPYRAMRFWACELSAVWQPKGGHTEVHLDAFAYDIRDYQVERSLTNFDYVVLNAPEATSRGLEITVSENLGGGFTIDAAGGWLETKFDRYTDPVTGVDFQGHKFPYAPAWTLSSAAQWRSEKGWFARLQARASGRVYFNESNNPAWRESGWITVDAAAGWEGRRFGVRLFARNLLDERYYSLMLPELRAGVPGEARVIGVAGYAAF